MEMIVPAPVAATHVALEISHSGHVGEARRTAQLLAEGAGLDEGDAGRLALVVTEAATNIAKHAGSGQILLRALGSGRHGGVEAFALDKGPGLASMAESLRDGHSTTGTSGTGLGAISRLSSRYDFYTRPGKGVALWCEVWGRDAPAGSGGLATGALCVPKPGETACGDSWIARGEKDRYVVLLVDGLGHGVDAAAAAHAATDVVAAHARRSAVELADAVHGALRGTRGAAAAVAIVKAGSGTGEFCGVGNLTCITRVEGKSRNLVSHNGILGHQVRRLQDFAFPFPPHALLIMHSDGLTARWSLEDYPGLETRHPALIAGVLYRDFRRGTDDASVMVARNASGA
jgi:anti-sigma regulatory factor (Ser/Thr protein kinase)